MKVACCQLDIAWEDPSANHRRAAQLVEQAKLEPGSLLLLPEMFATGFSMNAQKVAEPVTGVTVRFLQGLAARHHIYVVGGVALSREGEGPTNEAVCVTPRGDVEVSYRKVHLFSPAGENAGYTAGAARVTWSAPAVLTQPAVCYDLRFAELFRWPAKDAPQLIAIIANWPRRRHPHWLALLRARAIENQAYVAGVNRCGKDPACDYAGGSAIVDPLGNVLTEAGEDEQIIIADVDPATVDSYRQNFPALRDRRLSPPDH